MFSKSSKKPPPEKTAPASPPKPAPPSLISVDLKIVGDLSSDGEIQVDGVVEGDVRTNTLLVGKTAEVRGEIIAETVRVHGTVNSQIRARSVHLAKTAHVVGGILHEDLAIETGAFLEGHCKRLVEEPKEEAKDGAKTKSKPPTQNAAAAKPDIQDVATQATTSSTS